ncbi:adhesin [Actinoplanes sichuanensis]|uniref:Adhesin n=1 Tax=Actinoplanes sichuanensis TaxID=512349 RepID=A0ABW4AKC6_9ACTN|nr:adhesin [Actinoplanes sichuanensis]
MRATVGPLPPAVYWRRRVVVLGALLLGVIVVFVSCGGGDDSDPKKASQEASQYPEPTTTKSPSPTPSLEDSADPGVGQAYPDPPLTSEDPDDALPGPADPGVSFPPAVGTGTGTGGAQCADAEMQLTPVPEDTSPKRGASTQIQLKIKNVGTRTCTRDLGASAQEIYIALGAQRVWSSDQCAAVKGNDVQTLAPGAEKVFEVTWNGKQSNQCTGSSASGPIPGAGAYQLLGRLDTIVSTPVVLTVVN